MGSFAINLNKTSEKGDRYRRFLFIISLILVALLALTYGIFYLNGILNEWVFIISGIYVAAFVYFAFSGYKTALYINGDETALEYQLGFYSRAPIAILWQSIKKVKLGPTYIAFFKRSGKRKIIYLGWLPYAKLMEVKNHVEALCKELSIEVQHAEINREEE
jgi:hypothetical protein